MLGFGKKKESRPVIIPEAMKPEDPVNYNSVLDYLVGLSKADYNKIFKSADVYREANAKVAKIVGVKDEPTTSLNIEKPELSDKDMDDMLNADPDALTAAFIEDDVNLPSKLKKPQSTEKKIGVKE